MRVSARAAARSATSSASAGVVYIAKVDLAPVEAGAAAQQDVALLLLGHRAPARLGGLGGARIEAIEVGRGAARAALAQDDDVAAGGGWRRSRSTSRLRPAHRRRRSRPPAAHRRGRPRDRSAAPAPGVRLAFSTATFRRTSRPSGCSRFSGTISTKHSIRSPRGGLKVQRSRSSRGAAPALPAKISRNAAKPHRNHSRAMDMLCHIVACDGMK